MCRIGSWVGEYIGACRLDRLSRYTTIVERVFLRLWRLETEASRQNGAAQWQRIRSQQDLFWRRLLGPTVGACATRSAPLAKALGADIHQCRPLVSTSVQSCVSYKIQECHPDLHSPTFRQILNRSSHLYRVDPSRTDIWFFVLSFPQTTATKLSTSSGKIFSRNSNFNSASKTERKI